MSTLAQVITFEKNPIRALDRLWDEIDKTRQTILGRDSAAILEAARQLMLALGSVRVRVELAHAASAFAEGREERIDAEDWVEFAIAARAMLDRAEKSGAPELATALFELDESFEDAREAVLILDPHEYMQALAGAPPNLRAWWGERARIDAGLREIQLERALGALSEDDIVVDDERPSE